jgi:hypothetical protein
MEWWNYIPAAICGLIDVGLLVFVIVMAIICPDGDEGPLV